MPFDSPDVNLGLLLGDVEQGKIQLPDFQREWKWDDPRITSLLATITLGYPIGVLMTLEAGGAGAEFAPRPIAGTEGHGPRKPDQLVLDGQQRLTSLYQALQAQRPVDTMDPRGKKLQRWYLVDIERALQDDGDREESIISVPADLIIREDFGRVVKADYSTVERQCQVGCFPLWITFDMRQVFAWQRVYIDQDSSRTATWGDFYQRVLANLIGYTVPVIILKKSTPKEAVCTVFEKVNTGGVPLDVFELLTATFAGNKEHRNFRLNDDWKARRDRLAARPVLQSLASTDFLQAVTLLASRARRERHFAADGDLAQAPGITCKRRDILRLTLPEYLEYAPRAEAGFVRAAGFMAQQQVFRAGDLPYASQLVPLAAIKAALGPEADTHAADAKLRRWYWCGVLGELYSGTIETRFARDLDQVAAWIRDGGPEPSTVVEATFQASRLLTLRTRNSAAYKGIYALLMREGCLDWTYRQPMNIATFLDFAVDIHHIFPKAWCDKNGVDHPHRESVVNKTAVSARTNRMIGGRSPADYVNRIEAAAGITSAELDKLISTHLVDPPALRAAAFDAFFAARQARLLKLIADAMGKPAVDNENESPAAFLGEEDDRRTTWQARGNCPECGHRPIRKKVVRGSRRTKHDGRGTALDARQGSARTRAAGARARPAVGRVWRQGEPSAGGRAGG